MNSCPKCKAALSNNISFCPLCGSYITRENYDKSSLCYSKVNLKNGFKPKTVAVLNKLLFLSFCICTVIAIFNAIFNFHFYNWWYVYFFVSVFFVKIAVLNMISKQRYSWRDIVYDCVYAIIYIIFIDWYTLGFNGFSFSYAIPGVIAAGSILLTIFSINGIMNPVGSLQAFLIILIFNAALIVFNILMSAFNILQINFLLSVITIIALTVEFILLLFVRFPEYRKAIIKNLKSS